MKRESVFAKKRLGQNFLHDQNVIRRIVASLELSSSDVLLEVGCGTGALTRHLVSVPRQFIGVELDRSLCERLSNEYSSSSAFLLNQDILKIELAGVLGQLELPKVRVKVVGNLPYYISSPIIEWLGKQAAWIESATIMLQAEVADRLTALPGTREFGVLTLLSTYHFEVKKLMEVRPGAFRPIPKVSSTVLRLKPKPHSGLELTQELALFELIRRSFSHRRKTLCNCLKGSAERELVEAMLGRLGHAPDSRAEALSLDDFVALSKCLTHKALQ